MMSSSPSPVGERCACLVTGQASTARFAWCARFGRGKILPSDHENATKALERLTVGQWYSVVAEPDRLVPDAFIAFADSATPIAPIWKTQLVTTKSGQLTVKVVNVPAVIGAVHSNVAVGWSPFFRRLRLDRLEQFFKAKDGIRPGAALSLTIMKARANDDGASRWIISAVNGRLNGGEMQRMGVQKTIAQFDRFDREKEFCWLVGENREAIFFAACDFHRAGYVHFDSGDLFEAWIGEHKEAGGAFRAFYVELLDDNSRRETGFSLSSPSSAMTSSSDHRLPSPASAASMDIISSSSPVLLPIFTTDPLLANKTSPMQIPIPSAPENLKSSPIITLPAAAVANAKQTMISRRDMESQTDVTKTDEFDGCDQRIIIEGRKIYGRILANPDLLRAFCQCDPSILTDLYTIFNS